MSEFLKRTWAEIHLDRLQGNFQAIQASLAPGSQAMAVVKADGYGHGAAAAAKALRQAGAAWFGVSNLEEAVQLRRAGIDGDILILSFTPPEEAGRLAEFAVTQTVLSRPYAEELDAAAQAAGVRVRVHLKVDTGMSRVGFLYHREGDEAVLDDMAAACRLPHLTAEGIFTHFASADEEEDGGFTRRQFALFMDAVRRLEKRGVSFALRHCCNSAATLRYPEMHLDMVRPGIILYGLWPSDDLQGAADLRPVMTLYSRVALVKRVPAGACISYGRKYTAPDERVIATVTCGYADGYSRAFSGRASMLVRGQAAPVVGRVCMDQLMLDVTGIPDVQAGDEVIAAGGALPFDDLARIGGTIGYELVCGVSRRVPRVYVSGDEVLAVADYLE